MTDRELLEAIDKNLALLTQTVKAACQKIDHIEVEVDGNGKVGIKQSLNEHLVRHDERNRVLTWMASIGGGGGLAGFITGMVALFR